MNRSVILAFVALLCAATTAHAKNQKPLYAEGQIFRGGSFGEEEYQRLNLKDIKKEPEKKGGVSNNVEIDGKDYTTKEYDPSLLGLYSVSDRKTYALIGAYPCRECSAPARMSVYSIDDKTPAELFSTTHYAMPGKFHTDNGETLISDIRAFYGKCMSSKKHVILWQGFNLQGKHTRQVNEYVELTEKGVSKVKKATINLGTVLSYEKQGKCHEITPMDISN